MTVIALRTPVACLTRHAALCLPLVAHGRHLPPSAFVVLAGSLPYASSDSAYGFARRRRNPRDDRLACALAHIYCIMALSLAVP